MAISLWVDGEAVDLDDDGASLLEALRDRLGRRSAKDGCSPQGQCGCCTVLIDGVARVACVTPVRRVAGRRVTTLDGLDPAVRLRWAETFAEHGASQCGFCTPGIIMRLAALAAVGPLTPDQVRASLVAHLCRCTGWQTIVDAAVAAVAAGGPAAGPAAAPAVGRTPERDWAAATRRATIEGGAPQRVGPDVALGEGGFADDTAPRDALVAVPRADGGWAVAETLAAARAEAGKVQGRRTTARLTWPLEVPPGDWDVVLRTTWVEPAYLEPDASWCRPGGEPATPLANGGAFGGKVASPAADAARRLADLHGRPVRVVLAREDVVRQGSKRPPIAAGVRADGTGVIRVVRTAGIARVINSVAPGLRVEEIDVAGPPTSVAIRAAGWAEAAILLVASPWAAAPVAPASAGRVSVTIVSPWGSRASATVAPSGAIHLSVEAGAVLDATVLRSYCIGAAHQALGWVTSEGLALGADGVPEDLTIRSFGVLRARDMPDVTVELIDGSGPPVNGSDAVLAAVAAAVWIARGLPPTWPTTRSD